MTYEETQEHVEVAEEVEPGLHELASGEAAPVSTADEGSLLDDLRKKREEVADNTEVFIPLPGYDDPANPPIMLAKYRLMEGQELGKIGKKVQQETRDQWERQIRATVDALIAACDGIYYDMLKGEGPQQVTRNGVPIYGYTPELASILGFKAETAREVVMGVFVSNEVAIMQHGARFTLWLGNTSRKVDQDLFLGEG
jgi:hypothetical protein